MVPVMTCTEYVCRIQVHAGAKHARPASSQLEYGYNYCPGMEGFGVQAQNLPYPLLSDTDQLLRKSFGIKVRTALHSIHMWERREMLF